MPDYVIAQESYERAEQLVADVDPKDVAYVALSIELGATLLTRDKELHDGLVAKGYAQVQLFNEFISRQMTGA